MYCFNIVLTVNDQSNVDRVHESFNPMPDFFRTESGNPNNRKMRK